MTTDDWTRDELLAALEWQLSFGADEATGENPVDSYTLTLELAEKATQPKAAQEQAPTNKVLTAKPSQAKKALQSLQKTLAEANNLATGANTLSELKAALQNFDGCSLKKTAISTVFNEGTETSKLMIIMGTPRADEDREGKTVAGLNRILLNNMLKSIGLDIEQVYLTSCVFWRPPGDKKPTANDLAYCKPFVDRQISLTKPKVLMLLGETTLRSFTDPDASLLRQRGKWSDYNTPEGAISTKMISTFAPHMLLNTPRQKALAWQDLRAVKQQLSQI
ncbi:uracil-DNA glycosylase [Kiloniella antarctica]|uniref:Type-4 uracil-DNA glycosylase n=1 Tax=Kiloniella antarctica TaxID=1550907 RepID=A0ABW5BHR8_9PROT